MCENLSGNTTDSDGNTIYCVLKTLPFLRETIASKIHCRSLEIFARRCSDVSAYMLKCGF